MFVRRWTFPLQSLGSCLVGCGRLRPHLGMLCARSRCLCSHSRYARPHPCLLFSQPAQRRAAVGRAVCRHRSALVEHIDLLAPHHALLAAHSEQLVPRLQAICPHLPDLPLPDLLGRIDALGAPASRSFDGPFSLAANRIMLSWCRPRNAGPRLDQLLDAMSPSLQLFLPHVLQHVDTLGPHLALLIDSLDDLGAHTLSKQLLSPMRRGSARGVPAAPHASWLLEEEGRLGAVLRACAAAPDAGVSAALAAEGCGAAAPR